MIFFFKALQFTVQRCCEIRNLLKATSSVNMTSKWRDEMGYVMCTHTKTKNRDPNEHKI